MPDFYHIESIADVHRLFELDKPLHPLITVIQEWPTIDFDFSKVKLTSDLYLLGMKGNERGTFKYGRNSYDYEEGTLVFMSPQQVASFSVDDS